MTDRFAKTLNHIRSVSTTEVQKGRLFERLIKTWFEQDPLYRDRFSEVMLWSDWAARAGEPRVDIGIDLVAQERENGFCAIQCKCYAQGTRLTKADLDSFIAASNREPFTSRILINTGEEIGKNAVSTLDRLKPPCRVLHYSDLANQPYDWPDLPRQSPEDLVFRGQAYHLRTHQKQAFNDVLQGFQQQSRGQLIMACGTGKTLTALRLAEHLAGRGGRVLYLVPSIALFQQSMREWAHNRLIPHRYVGVCSDTRAGRTDEDASLHELEIPVTTDLDRLGEALQRPLPEAMRAVFCTYHSLELVVETQDSGAPPFDLVISDEAHRTTGIERPDDRTSPFLLVHDQTRLRAERRLYMTATPRLYTEGVKQKAAQHRVDVFSMDDTTKFGPEFHRLPFSRAVDQDLLTDYKVVILAVAERNVDTTPLSRLTDSDSEINLGDAARITGCWRALQNPENRQGAGPLRRAIAFTHTIATSQRLEKYWNEIIGPGGRDETQPPGLHCVVRHVDGRHHALDRKARIEWLKDADEGACRILTNARCLSEGIDVPALDAVLFMAPRKSPVDVVQAVGRVMRKAEGKSYGYIILPVAVPAGVDPAAALNDNERFAPVWSVLRALRSHDDRFNAEINRLDLNEVPSERILFREDGEDGHESVAIPFPPLDLPPGAVYARIVEQCGDRKYWDTWAKDVANIFTTLVHRIGQMLANREENSTLIEWFEAFHDELKQSINDSITLDSAIDMMAQHILTRPVFEALFEGYDFALKNPVSRALDALRRDFGEFGLEHETRDLEPFYESVRLRARGLDNSEARQRLLIELYEKFFATALKKEADRLGIVYTPVEIVDFILHSADRVLRDEFGRSLSEAGVHVLDPFTGTGLFLVRLLQSGLIREQDLPRKYREELHANELVLLAYYIAAIHIEEAYHGRLGMDHGYEPFDGIVLTDTFNLQAGRTGFPQDWLPENSQRVERQQQSPIQVIVGNPPWSAGQRSAADENPNTIYPKLRERIKTTYADRSMTTNKNSLYDSYKMALRWASDRIGKEGVVAFVTNGSWVDGNADSGVRACLLDEFTSIDVLHLRGNQRTQGERSRKEGGKVFGQGSRAPVAITVLVRNPKAQHKGCRIRYRDIGDYLSRQEKLDTVRQWGSMAGIEEWETITPDAHHDWIDQRDPSFQSFWPLGSKQVKAGRSDESIFRQYSGGLKTNRDAYIYNYSYNACAFNAQMMVENYRGALQELEASRNITDTIDVIAQQHASNLHWDLALKQNLRRRKMIAYSTNRIRTIQYRPFVKQHGYIEYLLINSKYQMDKFFPDDTIENRAIYVPGIGSTKPFSVLITDRMPDLHLVAFGQCFPRFCFAIEFGQPGHPGIAPRTERIDNITDAALQTFQKHYNDPTISKDQIFDYVYGLLHAPQYSQRFVNNLSKELPRIPLAPDFHAFAVAGQALATLHLGYESGPEHPLTVEDSGSGGVWPEHCRVGKRPMRLIENRSVLKINDRIRLTGIPPSAHGWQVNGRTPLEWLMDRYHIAQDEKSGIVNDPNEWFHNPNDLISAILRVVHVSVETQRIIGALPDPFTENMTSMR